MPLKYLQPGTTFVSFDLEKMFGEDPLTLGFGFIYNTMTTKLLEDLKSISFTKTFSLPPSAIYIIYFRPAAHAAYRHDWKYNASYNNMQKFLFGTWPNGKSQILGRAEIERKIQEIQRL
ncbi:hypothetical protein WAI453_004394 [Rhynchosporium graminicola]